MSTKTKGRKKWKGVCLVYILLDEAPAQESGIEKDFLEKETVNVLTHILYASDL